MLSLIHILAGTLGITGIEDLRVFKRYDIEGIGEEDFEYSKKTIFSEPNVDIVYEGSLPPVSYTHLPCIRRLTRRRH